MSMYADGFSVAEAAEHFGVTRQAMWMILKRRGCEFRPQTRSGKDNHFYRGGKSSAKKAHRTLERALLSGKIEKPERCEKCGKKAVFKDGRSGIQAHHSDYKKPLDVKWLCQKCHHEIHKI